MKNKTPELLAIVRGQLFLTGYPPIKERHKFMQTALKQKFQFSSDTIELIKKGATNYQQFITVLAKVKDNAFIYDYKGGADAFNRDEKASIVYSCKKLHECLDSCLQWRGAGKEKAMWTLCNYFGYVGEQLHNDRRLSSYDAVYEAFKITLIYKWQVTGEFIDSAEMIPAMQLWDWFADMVFNVKQDQELYNEL